MSTDAAAARQRQMSLALPEPARVYHPANYLITDANRQAVELTRAFLESGLESGELSLALCGSKGAGKTHLLHAVLGAGRIVYTVGEAFTSVTDGVLALNNCEGAGDPLEFLRLIELRKEQGAPTVFAGEGRPRTWAKGLNDLETRLEAMPRAELGDPDEPLLAAVLAQHFTSRRLRIPEDFAAFVAPRIPRTFAAAAAAHLGEPINLALAKRTIENLFEGPSQA